MSASKNGGPLKSANQITINANRIAPGIVTLSPSPLALPALTTTKDAFPTTPWIGNPALAPIIPASVLALTKTKPSA
jgi:hypothetical protein